MRLTLIVCAFAALSATAAQGQIAQAIKTLRNNQPPNAPFSAATAPPAPDYDDRRNWPALPETRDAADITPLGVAGVDQRRAPVDVFFIHPTTFFSTAQWNASTTDAANNKRVDDAPIRNQASVFNGCCRIYAPIYRQMTLGGYIRWSQNSEAASALAYSDVRRAFEHYLDRFNDGRPFIIAGHSQGSRHARRLIEEMVEGKPIARRFVAGYLVGHWIEREWFERPTAFPPCTRADDTGCILTWSMFAEGRNGPAQRVTLGRQSRYPPETLRRPYVCINPISWSAGAAKADKALNRGAWLHGAGERPRAPDVGLVSARCSDGAVYVSKPGSAAYTAQVVPFGNFHNLDYSMAYMNVRENASARVAAFLRKR